MFGQKRFQFETFQTHNCQLVNSLRTRTSCQEVYLVNTLFTTLQIGTLSLSVVSPDEVKMGRALKMEAAGGT